MTLLKSLWHDEAGFILSAELVLIGTLGVVGATVGLSMSAEAVNGEMQDFAFAMRSLDQSYSYQGFKTKRASFAGSRFTQKDISESLNELQIYRAEAEERAEEMRQEWRDRFQPGTAADDHET